MAMKTVSASNREVKESVKIRRRVNSVRKKTQTQIKEAKKVRKQHERNQERQTNAFPIQTLSGDCFGGRTIKSLATRQAKDSILWILRAAIYAISHGNMTAR